jgi:NAD(P)-dependent dehydrogenase (short-subunit alcohol dehydrogenase family)
MDPMSIPDLSGRVCVVTGANTGIGEVTARELAGAGARVILACRSESKTRPVIEAIKGSTGNDQVEFVALDLGDLASVRQCARALIDLATPIHVLINNAGLAGQRGVTKDGFELHFGVNHLGHFLLTTLLLDTLTSSAPARIVNVSSASHYQAKAGIPWDRVRGKTRSVVGMKEYEVSKLANALFSAELARRLEGTGVTTYALHPGVIASDVWRRVPWPVRGLMKRFMITTEEGARTSLYCATAPELASESGLYYDKCAVKKPSAKARDAALAAELWQRSEAWVGE